MRSQRRSSGYQPKPASASLGPRRHRPNYQIVLYMGLLLLLGLIVMFAIGPQRANLLNYAYGTTYGDRFFFDKQLVSVVLSVLAFGVLALAPYKLLTEKYHKKVFIIGLFLSIFLVFAGAVLHLSIANDTNGAYRWFYIGGIGSFQPSELLKFGILLFMANFLGYRAKQGMINNVQETLVPLAIVSGISLFVVVVMQKDLGTGVSLISIIMAMLFAAGLKAKHLLVISGVLAVVGMVFIFSAPHRMERVMTFMQGDSSYSADDVEGYHIQQARIAIGSGGLFGLGIGKSVQATGYLPEAINDSIFAIMGETFGFVGLVLILVLFTALLLSLLKIASRLPDMHLRLIVVGVFGWVASQVILNVAAMTGVAPLTGVTLPLLSYGGTSMMFIAAALGLVFQLSRYTSYVPLTTEGGSDDQSSRSRRWLGRPHHASRSSI